MVSQNSLMFAPGNQGNDLFQRDPSTADYAQGQRCPRQTQETPGSFLLPFEKFGMTILLLIARRRSTVYLFLKSCGKGGEEY
jgi:hypothetical protein